MVYSAVMTLLLVAVAWAETAPRLSFSLKRTAADIAEREAGQGEKPKKKAKLVVTHEYEQHEIEVWYINLKSRTDRRDCMEKQLTDMGIVPHRFEALEVKKDDIKEGGQYHDCLQAGLTKNSAYIDATAGGISSGFRTKMAIIGNTCSHKRLFDQIAKSNSTAKYFIVMEDDAILNPLKFKTAVNEFVDEKWGYKGKFAKDWQMIQLDFVGSSCKDHQVGRMGGKRVFKPKNIFQPGIGGADCSRYFGAQALVVQKDTLPSVVDHMNTHKVLPMDWVQGELPRGLAWRPQVARSPNNKFFAKKLPDFCSKSTHKSSISLKRKDDSVVTKKSKIDLNKWMDAFHSQTGADDASDDVKTSQV